MTSILTNHSAMAALQTLQAVGTNLTETQQQVSTGLRVGQASDNVAYWSISTTMKSDQKALTAVSDAIGITRAVLDTTYAGLDAIMGEFMSIKSLLVTAASMPTPDVSYLYSTSDDWKTVDPLYAQSQQAKVATDIDHHMQQIRSIFMSSSFAGTNLLYMQDNSSVEAKDVVNTFVTGYVHGQIMKVEIPLTDTLLVNDSHKDEATFSNMDPGNGGLFDPSFSLSVTGSDGIRRSTGIKTFTNWSVSASGGRTEPIIHSNDMVRTVEMYTQKYGADRHDAWDQVIRQWDERLGKLTDLMARVGSIQQYMERTDQLLMVKRASIEKGVSRLVDAEMEDASARLAAVKTQQQLALQSLQIANENPRRLLVLFG
ncbi:flagellin [Agrobacterium sp. SORGH_AS 787]|uniref:flagellin N-terminal helical domain-containing protein n=1 Tax=Agrobacterium sp. SORGH_AS 787 TaxID=3041775 RepID=UPI00277E061A|nr:flagellin [Rhizobium sp. SORGH_AS_0787]